jgi:hypothetical protein
MIITCWYISKCLWCNVQGLCVISGFRRKVEENCALLGYYAAYSGDSVPTFRDNLFVPYSGVKNPCYFVPTFRDNLSVSSSGVKNLDISYRRFGTTYRSHFRGSRIRCNLLPTFRDNQSVPSSGAQESVLFLTYVSGQPIGLIFRGQESGYFLPMFRDNLSVPFSGIKNPL